MKTKHCGDNFGDTNGDWIADTKIILDTLYAKNGVPEHSDNGLWRGIDNWYYNAKSTFKYKIIHDHWIKDTTEFRGQWGISHDDEGAYFIIITGPSYIVIWCRQIIFK